MSNVDSEFLNQFVAAAEATIAPAPCPMCSSKKMSKVSTRAIGRWTVWQCIKRECKTKAMFPDVKMPEQLNVIAQRLLVAFGSLISAPEASRELLLDTVVELSEYLIVAKKLDPRKITDWERSGKRNRELESAVVDLVPEIRKIATAYMKDVYPLDGNVDDYEFDRDVVADAVHNVAMDAANILELELERFGLTRTKRKIPDPETGVRTGVILEPEAQ